MSSITTHILDLAIGKPAKNVEVVLESQQGDSWKEIGRTVTDDDGRAKDLLSLDYKLVPGIYQISFGVAEYFETQNRTSFYPSVNICFEVDSPKEHYHVPLLLSDYGYSTYRGS